MREQRSLNEPACDAYEGSEGNIEKEERWLLLSSYNRRKYSLHNIKRMRLIRRLSFFRKSFIKSTCYLFNFTTSNILSNFTISNILDIVLCRNEAHCDSLLTVPCAYHMEAADDKKTTLPGISARSVLHDRNLQRRVNFSLRRNDLTISLLMLWRVSISDFNHRAETMGSSSVLNSAYRHVYFVHETPRYEIIYMHFADIHLQCLSGKNRALRYFKNRIINIKHL